MVRDAAVSSSAQPPRRGRTGDEVDVVDDRLHPGAEFLLKRARQVADVFAEGNRWARHQQAGVVMGVGHLVQTRGDGQKRFARAGLAHQSHQSNGGIEQ